MKLLITILLTFVSLTFAQDYHLPDVICYIECHGTEGTHGAKSFACIGDPNGDGYDDMLYQSTLYEDGVAIRPEVRLLLGGEEMDAVADMIFLVDRAYRTSVNMIRYHGQVDPDHPPMFSISSSTGSRPVQDYDRNAWIESFHYADEEMDSLPEFSVQRPFREDDENFIYFGDGFHSRPADFNGDGHPDLLGFEDLGDTQRLVMYYGGADFDTIPDWSVNYDASYATDVKFSVGYDVNGDGFDDFLVGRPENENFPEYSLFLGGDPPDTVAALEFPIRGPWGIRHLGNFSLLQDIDRDGYDDWAIGFSTGGTAGYYFFYGSEEPDGEPDVELAGHPGVPGYIGEMNGGDFNGDGYGDVITCNDNGYNDAGAVNIHFGHSHWPAEKEADIMINGRRDYGDDYEALGNRIDGVGDYNGDGIDDFIVRAQWGSSPTRLIIFAGSHHWRLPREGVYDRSIPESYDLSLMAYPNPFNGQVRFEFNLAVAGDVNLTIYDVQGRIVFKRSIPTMNLGTQSITWEGINAGAGVYFAVLSIEYNNETYTDRKKIVLMP